MSDEKILDISWGTILKVSLMAFAFYILYQIRDILAWFIFALMISVLFDSAVDALEKFKIPRLLAASFFYIAFFGILILSVYSIMPMFVFEIREFSQVLPQYFEKISPPLKSLGFSAFADIETAINSLESVLSSIAGNVLNVLFSIFGGIFTTLFVLTTAFFLSLEEKGVERALVLFFPRRYEAYVLSLWRKCQKKISNWFLTRLLACLFVAAVSYFSFLILNVKYPFTLALLSGIFNFIPVVGPLIIGFILFITVALENLLKAVFVTAIFVLIQQIENNVVTPVLSKKFIGLSPVLVMLSLAIGGVLWGVLGAILAVPLAGIVFEFLKDFLKERRERPGAEIA